jgi:hypothetical protein
MAIFGMALHSRTGPLARGCGALKTVIASDEKIQLRALGEGLQAHPRIKG